MIFSPGAVMSGLIAKSPSLGPRLENELIVSLLLTLPTATAASAAAGAPTFPRTPPLPAAATNSVPDDAVRLFTATARGSVPSLPSLPRLRLTTFARWAAAHSMPASTAESSQYSSPQTRPTSNRASGATPR